MGLRQTIKPASYPLNIEVVKDHLKVEHSIEDNLIGLYLAAATQYVEEHTGLALMQATYEQTFHAWPSDGVFKLRKIPLGSVTSIQYIDGNGATQTLSPSLYSEDSISKPGRVVIRSAPGLSTSAVNPITVTYKAGYAAQADIPAAARVLLLFLIGHWYANRESVLVGVTSKEIEFQTRNLLSILGFPEMV